MKAVICTRYEPPDVLQLADVPSPTPRNKQLLVRVITVDDGLPRPRAQDMLFIKQFFESGQFRAVIDRTYPLERIVEAHTYVDQGHKKGNVVIET